MQQEQVTTSGPWRWPLSAARGPIRSTGFICKQLLCFYLRDLLLHGAVQVAPAPGMQQAWQVRARQAGRPTQPRTNNGASAAQRRRAHSAHQADDNSWPNKETRSHQDGHSYWPGHKAGHAGAQSHTALVQVVCDSVPGRRHGHGHVAVITAQLYASC